MYINRPKLEWAVTSILSCQTFVVTFNKILHDKNQHIIYIYRLHSISTKVDRTTIFKLWVKMTGGRYQLVVVKYTMYKWFPLGSPFQKTLDCVKQWHFYLWLFFLASIQITYVREEEYWNMIKSSAVVSAAASSCYLTILIYTSINKR